MATIARTTSITLSLAAAVLVAACGSSNSTGPTPPTASAEALHIDSLWAASNALGDANYNARLSALTLAEYSLAYGGRPSFFSVSVSGAKQTWTGASIYIVSAGDTEAVQILWDDANADNIFIGGLIFDGGGADSLAEFVAADTIEFDANTGTVVVSATSEGTGGTCSLQSGLQNADLSNIFGSDQAQCASVVLSGAVDLASTVPTGAEAGLASFSYSNSNSSGEFFYNVTDPARIPARSPAANKIRAILQQIRARQSARVRAR
jgi:hypothetical protein